VELRSSARQDRAIIWTGRLSANGCP
jgi:hypothetical protein